MSIDWLGDSIRHCTTKDEYEKLMRMKYCPRPNDPKAPIGHGHILCVACRGPMCREEMCGLYGAFHERCKQKYVDRLVNKYEY